MIIRRQSRSAAGPPARSHPLIARIERAAGSVRPDISWPFGVRPSFTSLVASAMKRVCAETRSGTTRHDGCPRCQSNSAEAAWTDRDRTSVASAAGAPGSSTTNNTTPGWSSWSDIYSSWHACVVRRTADRPRDEATLCPTRGCSPWPLLGSRLPASAALERAVELRSDRCGRKVDHDDPPRELAQRTLLDTQRRRPRRRFTENQLAPRRALSPDLRTEVSPRVSPLRTRARLASDPRSSHSSPQNPLLTGTRRHTFVQRIGNRSDTLETAVPRFIHFDGYGRESAERGAPLTHLSGRRS